MAELVSVIIPTYNRSRLLAGAIESVYKQTYRDFEVIVSDDGSTDDSEKVTKERFPDVVYIKHEHGGVSFSRNIAISRAKGELLAFLDDDDYWERDFLSRCVDRMAHGDFVGVVTNYFKLYPSGKRVIGYRSGKVPPQIDLKWIVRGSFIDPSCVVVKKDAVIDAGMFDETLEVTEDWDLWLRMLRKGRFAYIDEPLVYKRVVVDSSLPLKTYRHNAIVLEKFYSSLSDDEKEELKEALETTRFRVFLRYATAMLHTGERRIAREYLIKALSIKPFNPKAMFRYILTFMPPGVARMFDGVYWRKVKYMTKTAKYR